MKLKQQKQIQNNFRAFWGIAFWLLTVGGSGFVYAENNTFQITIPYEEVDLRTCSGTQPFVSNEIISEMMSSGPGKIEVLRLKDPNTGQNHNFIINGHHSASAEYLKGNYKVRATICKDAFLYGKTPAEVMAYLGTWPTQVEKFSAASSPHLSAAYANRAGISSLSMPGTADRVKMQIGELQAIDGLFSQRTPLPVSRQPSTVQSESAQASPTECSSALTAAAFFSLKDVKW